jgi:hypothetical protein
MELAGIRTGEFHAIFTKDKISLSLVSLWFSTLILYKVKILDI